VPAKDLRGDAGVVLPEEHFHIVRVSGPAVHVHDRPLVQLEEAHETAGVVVVPVRNHGEIYCGEVDAHAGGVVREEPGCARIVQDARVAKGEMQREPLFGPQPRASLGHGVFRKDSHNHGMLPARGLYPPAGSRSTTWGLPAASGFP
jgi:hypothetical protein